MYYRYVHNIESTDPRQGVVLWYCVIFSFLFCCFLTVVSFYRSKFLWMEIHYNSTNLFFHPVWNKQTSIVFLRKVPTRDKNNYKRINHRVIIFFKIWDFCSDFTGSSRQGTVEGAIRKVIKYLWLWIPVWEHWPPLLQRVLLSEWHFNATVIILCYVFRIVGEK